MIEQIDLHNLEKRVMYLLDEYKLPLIQVLRYREESWFVPNEIELPIKHIIKNFQNILEKKTYTHTFRDFSLQKKDNNSFIISSLVNKSQNEVKIYKKNQTTKKHWAYRNIHYQWMIYEELHLSGNTYNHILSQSEKVKNWTTIDQKAWIISLEEKQKIIIRNYFHDIPEYKDGDIICINKTDKDSNNEDKVADEIITNQDWTSEEKVAMRKLSTLHGKQKLFKLYEIMFYIFDIQNMVQNKNKYHESSSLVVATLWSQIPRFIKNYELPNGKIFYWLDIPSCKQHLKKHMGAIDNLFAYTETIKRLEKREIEYQEWKKIWNEIIKPYIIEN